MKIYSMYSVNEFDPQAIAVYHNETGIGYVCRGLTNKFQRWIDSGFSITGVIEKKNGTLQNPKIYVFVKVGH